jgi:hypothetical protein
LNRNAHPHRVRSAFRLWPGAPQNRGSGDRDHPPVATARRRIARQDIPPLFSGRIGRRRCRHVSGGVGGSCRDGIAAGQPAAGSPGALVRR